MNPNRPSFKKTPEHGPRWAPLTLEDLSEALREAGLPSDDLVWLGEVVGGRFPGVAAAQELAKYDIDLRDLSGASSDRKKAFLVECSGLANQEYLADLRVVAEILNDVLRSRTGQFVIPEADRGVLVSLDIQEGKDREVELKLNTSEGVICTYGLQLDVDITRLSGAEQRAVSQYRRKYQLTRV